MREFFKPWRRKFGVVTLLMACVFMAGWVRSCFVRDNPYCKAGKATEIGLISNGQYLGIMTVRNLKAASYGWNASPLIPFEQNVQSEPELWWPWSLPGFGFTESRDQSWEYWSCPYWSLVLPLTLLSAWLPFSKPQPATQAKANNTTPTEGT